MIRGGRIYLFENDPKEKSRYQYNSEDPTWGSVRGPPV